MPDVRNTQNQTRYDLVPLIEHRDENSGHDSTIVNAYHENINGSKWVVKRPGYTEFIDEEVGVGKGIYSWRDTLFVAGESGLEAAEQVFYIPHSFQVVSDPPTGSRSRAGVVTLENGKVVVIGGLLTGSVSSDKVDIYDPSTDTWSSGTPIPDGVFGGVRAASLGNNKVLVVASNDSPNRDKTYEYDAALDSWLEVDPIPLVDSETDILVMSMTSVLRSGVVVAVGIGTIVPFKKCYFYVNGSWNTLPDFPRSAQSAAVSVALNGDIIVSGGVDFTTHFDTTYKLNYFGWVQSGDLDWVQVETMVVPLSAHSQVTLIDGSLLVMGGGNATDSTNDKVYINRLDGNGWAELFSTFGGVGVSLGQSADVFPTSGRVFWHNRVSTIDTLISGATLNTLRVNILDDKVYWEETDNTLLMQDGNVVIEIDDAFVVQQITDIDFPTQIVPGIVQLNGYTFVMTPTGEIHNSDLENAQSWNALSFITAEIEPDGGVAISKYRNYLVAFGNWTTEFFYVADANAAPGVSPLARTSQALTQIGCAAKHSVYSEESRIFFVAQNRSGGRFVARLNEFDVERISTAPIDRYLEAEGANVTNLLASGFSYNGHTFYIIELPSASKTFVWDDITEFWYEWSTGEAPFDFVAQTLHVGTHLIQNRSDGVVHTLSGNIYQDNGTNFEVLLRTRLLDYEVPVYKFMSKLYWVGDSVSGESPINLEIRYTDDDYRTWSNWRALDLTKIHPMLSRLGSFYRRAFEIRFTQNAPLRAVALDFEFDTGASRGLR